MPSSIEVKHPNADLSITFTESDHSYIDSERKRYTSVTTLIGAAFPKFDADAVAKKVAAKTGEDPEELKRIWEENGLHSRTMGTRLHETCEATLLEKEWPHEPSDEKEKAAFNICSTRCKAFISDRNAGIIKEYHPEYLVFSPHIKLAGSIDLLVKYDDGHYHIYDWKNLGKPLSKTGYGYGNIPPTVKVQDTNYWHYALQLQLYEAILKLEGYIDIHAQVDHTLLIMCNGELTEVPMQEMASVTNKLIKWHVMKTKMGI